MKTTIKIQHLISYYAFKPKKINNNNIKCTLKHVYQRGRPNNHNAQLRRDVRPFRTGFARRRRRQWPRKYLARLSQKSCGNRKLTAPGGRHAAEAFEVAASAPTAWQATTAQVFSQTKRGRHEAGEPEVSRTQRKRRAAAGMHACMIPR